MSYLLRPQFRCVGHFDRPKEKNYFDAYSQIPIIRTPKGENNLFELSNVRVLSKVNINVNCSAGKEFVRINRMFELSGIRTIGI